MNRADGLATRKVVTIGEFEFTIRKMAADEMIALGFFPEGVLDGTTTNESAAIREVCGPDTPGKVSRIIAAAVTSHKIWLGSEETCPPDHHLWIGDMADVRDALFKAIYEHSKLAEVVADAARFRDRDGLGGDAVGDGASGGLPADGPPAEPVAS